MEEIDYEKLYKESLERAKKLHKDAIMLQLEQDIKDYEYIFPVLAESEDEKIRKEIIDYIKNSTCQVGDETYKSWIAWFEKQGEQKPTDKVEPKFKVGDYLVTDYCKGKVIALTDYAYLLDTEQRIPFSCEHNAHLWTIQDAKGGDVLQLGEVTAIFKELICNGNCKCYCSVYRGEFEISIPYSSYGYYNATPASKEQRDLLFQKMNEAGYEWDAEKKELKKTSNALEECEIENIEHGKYYYCIKDYFCGGKKQASKGDVVQALRGMSIMALGVKANEYFLPVNSIKQKPAWSEEDERMLVDCFNILHRSDYSIDKVTKTVNWLKSLKDRVQPQWKPSDEQLDALHDAAVYVDKSMFPYPKGILMKMYKQLKKL